MSTLSTATPPRRPHDLAASHSSVTPRPSASSSSMSATAAAAPVSLDGLLSLHQHAPNPAIVALEQVIGERNLLSSQNFQLWKVIEKSRAAYIEAQKNLDRVRAERDAYKSRLQTLGENTDAVVKSYREKDKSGKPSSSNSSGKLAATASPSSSRAKPTRHQSDDTALTAQPQTLTPEWTAAARPTVTVSHTQPEPPSPNAPSVHSPTSSGRPPSATRSGSLPVPANLPQATSSSRPLQIPKPDSVPPTASAAASPMGLSQSPFSEMSNGSLSGTSPAPSPSDYSSHQGFAELTPASSTPSLHPPRPPAVSHESRTSLPDEARQYLSSMNDSPLPSPRPPLSQSRNQSPAWVPAAEQRAESPGRSFAAPESVNDKASTRKDHSDGEFLDMDDEESLYDAPMQDRGRVSESPAEASQEDEYPPQSTHKIPAVDDFPLPPISHPSNDGHGDIDTLTHARHGAQHEYQDAPNEYQAAPLAIDRTRLHEPFDLPTTPTASAYNPHLSAMSNFQSIIPETSAQPLFRALPLLPHDLPRTRITVTNSTIRPNDRGKDVLTFVVYVDPGSGKEAWTVEKMYSDVLGLDQRVRSRYGKSVNKRVPSLPDGKLWKDHAPSKVDQRKAVLEKYVQALIDLPIKNNDEIIAFLTSDIIKETNKPIVREGYKEGYLTKRGKNFGGWKTRFFVVQGPSLEYYENRGGTHLGSIPITGAQIGRQQRPTDRRETEEEGEYRHAFLIIEPKRGAVTSHRHVLCAESDQERDDWVDMLVRYVSGSYNDEPVMANMSMTNLSINTTVSANPYQPRSSTSSIPAADTSPQAYRDRRMNGRTASLKDEIAIGSAVPISKLAPDPANTKLFQNAAQYDEASLNGSPVKGNDSSPIIDRAYTDAQNARRLLEKGHPSSSAPASDSPLSSSLPTPSPLDAAGDDFVPSVSPRANSELGHYPDLAQTAEPRGARGTRHPQPSPERARQRQAHGTSFHPTLNPVQSSPVHSTAPDRAPSPDTAQSMPRPDANGKVKISGPMNGTPIPAGYKFGAKDAPREETPAQSEHRRDKAKSRMFWGWRQGAEKPPAVAHVQRAVFGVTLEESLDVAQIASLPAIVFRCIQYLEEKKADQEEGIYRLSGSSAVIKSLKDKFNAEGDVDLLASDEFWDPHAIAGLLKGFFRDLPASILTRDLHMRFLAVIDLVDPQERITELSRLIAMLPIENYSLLRALTAHLILIVQNAHINKMTMRNVGIVFSPTLGIPAGVFSLMLAEFNRVFNVDDDSAQTEVVIDERGNAIMQTVESPPDAEVDLSRRNSRQYTDAAADQLLGFTGRKLTAPEDDGHSDYGEDLSLHDESGTETTVTTDVDAESGKDSPQSQGSFNADASQRSRISNVAATRGLNIRVGESRRHSRTGVVGLPLSPRPPMYGGSGAHTPLDASPMHTPR